MLAPTSQHQQYPLQPAIGPKPDPDALTKPQKPEQHKRVYQACIPCRRRKVKCDLGSVDNPSDPPCVRCRRESKECYFSATRRKRKTEDGGQESADGYEFGDDYIVRNGRKMVHGSTSPPATVRQSSMAAPTSAHSATFPDISGLSGPPLTPGGSVGRTQPLRRPNHASPERNADEALENLEAQEVMRRELYGPHDALDLLYKAATDSPMNKKGRSQSSHHLPPMLGLNTAADVQQHPPIQNEQKHFPSDHMRPPELSRDAAINPALSAEPVNEDTREKEAGYKDAVKAWARFRFVRAGWFTPSEAIAYIDYYYRFLSPLTPISPPTFSDSATHSTLLNEEPILTITLLTIATRYKEMPGPGGHCRSHAIHEQLWTYLRGMIERCFWGQEAFGGGFYGAAAPDACEAQTSSTAPWRGMRKGSLRTLGTIESLMLLTEWHPRALHFPPAEATDELMLPSYDAADSYSTDDEGGHRLPGGVGGRRIESWLEPAWRSDRMCWMLLSTGMGLAYELGVFDDIEESLASGGEMTKPEYEDEAYRLRAARIKRLLLIYVTQLAGRLGWTNMVPENLRTDPAKAPKRRRQSLDGKTPDTSTSVSNTFNYIPDLELDDQMIYCWAGISNAMRLGNERLFKSRPHTTKIIQDGTYIEILKDFQPMLSNWKREFDRFQMPPYIKHILAIEYEYVRIYINSLSLQAVVERCTTNAGSHSMSTRPLGPLGTTEGVVAMSPETQNYYGKMPLAKLGGFGVADQAYVKEVIEGSRSLLRTVVEGLLPNEFLKHAPVRTYFRIISGAMFLLKTFALGASRHDVEISLGLMDSAVEALRTCIVDDVHLGVRFADLLATLTSRLRSRFISAPTLPPPNGEHAGKALTAGIINEPDAKRQKLNPRDHINEWNARTSGFGGANGPLDPNLSANPFDNNQPQYYPGAPYSLTPGGSVYNPNDQVYSAGSEWPGTNEMWYLPPGAAFFQNVNDQAITQTAEGVQVGGMDLLDYMVSDFQPAMDTGTF